MTMILKNGFSCLKMGFGVNKAEPTQDIYKNRYVQIKQNEQESVFETIARMKKYNAQIFLTFVLNKYD